MPLHVGRSGVLGIVVRWVAFGAASGAGLAGADGVLPALLQPLRTETPSTLTGSAGAGGAGADPIRQTQEIDRWERLDGVYAEQLRAVSAREDLVASVADLESRQSQAAVPDRPLSDAPTFERLEQLYDQRNFFVNAKAWLERDLNDATDDLSEARNALTDRERERRAVQEKSDADPAQFLGALRLAEISDRIAIEAVNLRRHAQDTLRVQASLSEPSLQLVLPEMIWVKAHLVASVDQAEQRDQQRRVRTAELQAKFDLAHGEVDRASVALSRHETGPATDTAVAELDPWRGNRRLAGSRLSLLGRQLLRVDETRTVEQDRLAALFRTAESDDLKT